MFKVKAEYNKESTIKSGAEQIRQFFADIRNFIELMPNIESITTDAGGTTRWKIRAEIPFLGAMTETFMVALTDNTEDRIAWTPANAEKENFLRYSADFIEQNPNQTSVRIRQTVELRRDSARQLHLLAGLAGETVISQQMQKRIEAMINSFLEKARVKLENTK